MDRRSVLHTLFDAGVAAAGVGSFRLWGARPVAQQPEFTLRSESRLVQLDVAVRDRKNATVSGLTKEAFSVFENGRPQQISVFTHEDVPVNIGLLIDESFSMKPKRSEVLAAAEIFIGHSNPKDEVFVLNFNDRVTRGLPAGTLFSDDIHKLRDALHRGTPQGRTALNDAVEEGLKMLQQGRREKKAMVLISDGGDNASAHTRRQVVSMLEKSTATVYAIGIYDDGDPDRDPAFLKMLCSVSGGEAFFPRPEGTASICRRIAADIRSRYTLGYVPLAGTTAGLRRIRVSIQAPPMGRLTALTRTSYLYDDNRQKE